MLLLAIPAKQSEKSMKNPRKLFPLIVTKNLSETRKFYTEQAGFISQMDQDGYLQVRSRGGEDAPELCFIEAGAMPGEAELSPFAGEGLIVSIPVTNADNMAASLEEKGEKLLTLPLNKPWGWRSFWVKDPNGITLDFFHVVKENPMLQADAPS